MPPLDPRAGAAAVLEQLAAVVPRGAAVAVSFVMIGRYWLGHPRMFLYIRRDDAVLLLLTLLLLGSIALLPFPTALFGASGTRAATVFYAPATALTGLVSAALRFYATAGGRLLARPLSAGRLISSRLQTLRAPLVRLVAAAVALVSAEVARGDCSGSLSWWRSSPSRVRHERAGQHHAGGEEVPA